MMFFDGLTNRRPLGVSATLAAAALALLMQPADATASSCIATAEVLWPADGGTLPEGGLVAMEVSCANPEQPGLLVTIDEEPAELLRGPAGDAYIFDPPPTEGQTVVIEKDFDVEFEPLEQFDPVSFVIGPAVQRPVAAPEVGLEFILVGSEFEEYVQWHVEVTTTSLESSADAPVFYDFVGTGNLTQAGTALAGAESVVRRWPASRLPEPGEEFCVTVRTTGADRSKAPDVTECIVVEAEPEHDCRPWDGRPLEECLDEPDAGGEDAGGEDEDGSEAGCGCAAGGQGGATALGLFALVGLGLRRRRKRG